MAAGCWCWSPEIHSNRCLQLKAQALPQGQEGPALTRSAIQVRTWQEQKTALDRAAAGRPDSRLRFIRPRQASAIRPQGHPCSGPESRTLEQHMKMGPV